MLYLLIIFSVTGEYPPSLQGSIKDIYPSLEMCQSVGSTKTIDLNENSITRRDRESYFICVPREVETR